MATYSKKLNAVFYHVPKTAGLFVDDRLCDHVDFLTYNFLTSAKIDFYWNINKGVRQAFHENLHAFLINVDDMKECYEFTFVRNPYTRFISAFFYCKSEKFDDPQYMTDIQTMIDNIEMMSYETFFHIFKTQKQNLVFDPLRPVRLFDKPLSFIGKFENLHNDFKKILIDLDLPTVYDRSKINENKIKYGNYKQYYTPEILKFVNEHFKEDFEEYNYEIVQRIEDLP